MKQAGELMVQGFVSEIWDQICEWQKQMQLHWGRFWSLLHCCKSWCNSIVLNLLYWTYIHVIEIKIWHADSVDICSSAHSVAHGAIHLFIWNSSQVGSDGKSLPTEGCLDGWLCDSCLWIGVHKTIATFVAVSQERPRAKRAWILDSLLTPEDETYRLGLRYVGNGKKLLPGYCF